MGVEDAASGTVSAASGTAPELTAATPIPGPSPLQGEGRRPRRVSSRTTDLARRFRKEPTVAERILWEALRKKKLNFRRQVPIGKYVADFAHLSSRLIIEIDGPHHDLPEQQQRDAARTAWLNAEGYSVIRFPERQVRNELNVVIDRIMIAATQSLSPALRPSKVKGAARYDVR